VKVLLS